MSEQFANLGAAVVFDASNLFEGKHIDIDGQLLVVTKIVDGEHVYTRPVVGLELVRYRLAQHKVLVCAVIAIIAAVLLLIR